MDISIAIAGRFGIDLLVRTAKELMGLNPGRSYDSWGLAYCYGNRLEVARSGAASPGRLEFDTLAEVKTDMAILYLNEAKTDESRGLEQPFVHGRGPRAWAFCHQGKIQHPERLRIENRIPDGPSSSERYFLHVLAEFDIDDPVESMVRIQSGLDEPEQNLLLLGADVLVVSSWEQGGDHPGFWLGQGELLRVVSPSPVPSFKELDWEPIPDRTVFAITRFRRVV